MQVLDGIFCHDGELLPQSLTPQKDKTFLIFEEEMRQKEENPSLDIRPMTLEGCVVRMSDTISYIGRDIEDAIRLGLIKRENIPNECKKALGDTNGNIVYTLVEDLVANSINKPYVCFSSEVGEAIRTLKQFNQENIYQNKNIKKQTHKIKLMFELLFEKYLKDLKTENQASDIFEGFLEGMSNEYKENTIPVKIVRDFIAGMTDDYFLSQCYDNIIPNVRSSLFN